MASELERVSDLLVEETRRSDAGSRELQDCQNLLADRLTQVEVVEQAYQETSIKLSKAQEKVQQQLRDLDTDSEFRSKAQQDCESLRMYLSAARTRLGETEAAFSCRNQPQEDSQRTVIVGFFCSLVGLFFSIDIDTN